MLANVWPSASCMLNVMCVACAEAALLLGNLWRDGGAAVVAEVRFSFPVIVTVQSCKIPVAHVCVFALMLGILGVSYELQFICSLVCSTI